MSIFKPCDVRGLVGKEITAKDCYNIAKAIVRSSTYSSAYVVGSDHRESSHCFREAVIQGIYQAQNSVVIVDAQAAPTPVIHRLAQTINATSIVVTASHNPPQYNGIKWLIGGSKPATVKEMDAVRNAGKSNIIPYSVDRITANIPHDYIRFVRSRFNGVRANGRKIVLDPMYGCWSDHAVMCLDSIYNDINIETIRNKPASDFCGIEPDPSVTANLIPLRDKVLTTGAELGVAFDGDGDRMALVDDTGHILSAEEIAWCLIKILNVSGRHFICDVKFSNTILDYVRKRGGVPEMSMTGHTFIRRMMHTHDAILGAEVGKHFYFSELGYVDDGFFAAMIIIDYLFKNDKTLSNLLSGCPKICITSDLRIPVDEETSDKVMTRMSEIYPDNEHMTIDGERIVLSDGFILARKSGTQPVLTLRFESSSRESLGTLIGEFCGLMPEIRDNLMNAYQKEAKI